MATKIEARDFRGGDRAKWPGGFVSYIEVETLAIEANPITVWLAPPSRLAGLRHEYARGPFEVRYPGNGGT